MKKRTLAILLILCLLLSILPVGALATERVAGNENTDTVLHRSYINPLYTGVLTEEDLVKPTEDEVVLSDGTIYASYREAGAFVRSAMKNRQQTVSITLAASLLDDSDDFWYAPMTEAMRHTGIPTEGDYILWQYGGWDGSASYDWYGNITVTYTMTYYTTAAQEREVDTAVTSLLKKLPAKGNSDYCITRAVYDYVTETVRYDYDHLSNPYYTLQYTAYAALINKTSVCQGYAVLMYRLLLELGVDVRVVTSEDHAWNIVRIGKLYYNADATWDEGMSEYSYFLKAGGGSTPFDIEHPREDPYDKPAFYKAYPMSAVDYAPLDTNPEDPFDDLSPSEYYYTPVLWAVKSGITAGTSPTTFSPEKTCTRAQVVTFLWRAAGKPAPTSNNNPFTDVKSNQYYYEAVLWAVEQGITAGTSSTTFSPEKPCTRAQVVTFQWRAAGKPTPSTKVNPFTDVASGQYYYDAVLWAGEKGITQGTSKTEFSPDKTCTRGQIVTFLYRQYA